MMIPIQTQRRSTAGGVRNGETFYILCSPISSLYVLGCFFTGIMKPARAHMESPELKTVTMIGALTLAAQP